MSRIIISCSIFILFSLPVFSQTEPQPALSPQQIAQRSIPSVVMVIVKNEVGAPVSFGTGFIIRENIIATNLHVIEGAALASQIFIRINGAKFDVRATKLLAIDEREDLAVIEAKSLPIRLTPLPIGDSSRVRIGDTVYAVGNPEAMTGTFSQGLVSGRRKFKDGWRIQITAPISSGSSGGPILNSRGEVVGLAVGIIEDGQNLNFAIPSSALRDLLDGTLDSPSSFERSLSELNAASYLKNNQPKTVSSPPKKEPDIKVSTELLDTVLEQDKLGWTFIVESNTDLIFYRRNLLTKYTANIVQAWVKYMSKDRANKDNSSAVVIILQHQFNCSERTFRVLVDAFYNKNGQILNESNSPTPWKTAVPDSVIEYILRHICDSK